MKALLKVTALGALAALTACSALESDKVDYRSSPAKAPSLVVPPDLTQLNKDARYSMVDGAVSAGSKPNAGSGAAQAATPPGTALGDVRVERAGNQRWLVVKRPAGQLWAPIRDFWLENGFLMSVDQAELGIMETEWAENRAKLPQDIIRATIGKALDALYSTPERDKYRTRLETNANGETEIYITHRGMAEVYVNERNDQTMWQPRPEDPELEAEFLRRLMVKLGSTPEQAQTQVAAATAAKPVAVVGSADGHPVVQIAENFDRAWRRVGLSLDRTGFTVEDRDRARGLYFVRYAGNDAQPAEPGFFGKLFGGGNATKSKPGQSEKYQILVQTQGEGSTVSVLDNSGAPAAAATAQRIVRVIADDIR